MNSARILELLIAFVIVVFVSVLPTVAFWRICSKAGLSRVLSLFMLVPMVNVVFALYVAFAEWPGLKQNE